MELFVLYKIAQVGFFSLSAILFLNCYLGYSLVSNDINLSRSSSMQLGEYIKHSKEYQDAIIIAEPDYLLESLPFYSDNLIYFPRENRFGQTVKWTSEAKPSISISDLLLTSQEIYRKYHKPVLIILGHFEITETTTGSKNFSYNKTFSWNKDELSAFLSSTTLIAEFKDAYTDENYLVFALR